MSLANDSYRVAIIASTGDQDASLRKALGACEEDYEILVFPIYQDIVQVLLAAKIHGLVIYWDDTHEQMRRIYQALRTSVQLPMMLVVPENRQDLIIQLLEQGADNCVDDHIAPSQLAARFAALLRRVWKRNNGNFSFEAPKYEHALYLKDTQKGNLKLYLTEEEYELLTYLSEHKGTIVEHKEICMFLWKSFNANSITRLRSVIHSIRKKVDSEEAFIKTQWGVGYALIRDLDL